MGLSRYVLVQKMPVFVGVKAGLVEVIVVLE
jgi:hypothetical protein